MKKLLLFIFLFAGFKSFASGNVTLTATNGQVYVTNASIYNNVDTLFIDSTTTYSFVYLKGITKATGQTLVLCNKSKKRVNLFYDGTSLSLEDCIGVKVIGILTDTSKRDGIYASSLTSPRGVGFEAKGYSKRIEFSHVTVFWKAYGFEVKNEVVCKQSGNGADTALGHWVLDSFIIHDNNLYDIGYFGTGEGMYLGSTAPNGLDLNRTYPCGTSLVKPVFPEPLPSPLGVFLIYRNRIDSTGRSGIQLSNARVGRSKVYDNIITRSGTNFESNGQGCGLSFGGWTRVSAFHNSIDYTYTMAIQCFGSGLDSIYSNTASHIGNVMNRQVPATDGLYYDTKPTIPTDSSQFYISGNTFNNYTGYAVHIYKSYNTYKNSGNIVCNNNGTTFISAGINYVDSCSSVDTLPTIVDSAGIHITGITSDVEHNALSIFWSNGDSYTASLPVSEVRISYRKKFVRIFFQNGTMILKR